LSGGLKSALRFLARLIDVLQRLEGQHGGADLAGLAIPYQLHLAFVRKEQEAVFFRQGFPLLNELDEIALLSLGEIVVFSGWTGHGGNVKKRG
jgi:hypothetical protein